MRHSVVSACPLRRNAAVLSVRPKVAELVFQLFQALASSGKTILMVTHDNELAERAQRTIRLADGQIVDEFKN